MDRDFVAPPYTNRGVQNTSTDPLRALVDWFSFTFTNCETWEEMISFLGMDHDDFFDSGGGLGYKSSKRSGHIAVFYDGAENMGCHVVMSGQGCREYESMKLKSWPELFSEILNREDGNITRLDVAIDDFKPYFKLHTIKRMIKKGLIRSRFKSGVHIERVNLGDGSSRGHTIYFGSEKSDVQIRFYEKNHERMNKGYVLQKDIKDWNRYEIQANDQRAQVLAMLICQKPDDLGKVVAGVIKSYINFLKEVKDKNKSRWPIAKFWSKFLGDVEPLRLTLEAPDKTIEKKYRWQRDSGSRTLASLYYAFDGDLTYLFDYLNFGFERLTDEDWDLINRFKQKKLSYLDFLLKLGIKNDPTDQGHK